VVEEGERYKFGDVAVESQLRDFDSTAMTNALPMKAGDWYDAKLVEDTLEQLEETAGTFGYAFADVRPDYEPDRTNKIMGVRFIINEAPRVYVERVDVNGNTLTQDKVVRREFRVAEGDAFNSLAIKRSTARINSLGYFQENFEVDQVEGSAPDRIILEANVQEQATGELSLSAGYSSLENFIFQGSIRQKNFRGRGQTVGLSVNYSRYSRSGSISFTEPFVFDKNISAGIDLYRRDYNNGYYDRASATYESATTGLQARVGVPLTEYLTAVGRYTFNHEVVSVNEDLYFADLNGDGVRTCEPLLSGRYLCDALGTRTSSILGLSLIHDSLDSHTRPTRGESATLSLDFAGLGGSTRYARAIAQAGKYWQPRPGFIFSVTAEGGYIKGLRDRGPGLDDVLLTDRFFLGEPQIRGFDIRGVGPRVIRRFYGSDGNPLPLNEKTNQDDALGGTAFYVARAELEIPLGSGARELGLRPSIFVDAGAVFGVKTPELAVSPFPFGRCIDQCFPDGAIKFAQIDAAGPSGTNPCVPTVVTEVRVAINPNPPACLASANNAQISQTLQPFVEEFYGDTAKPRVAIGIGVNWNSPVGPLRLNFSYPLLKERGDDTKRFSFNVGTQF
jgi:outer membrane protein insertion porin family